MKFAKRFVELYLPSFARTLVYMLQASEYDPRVYFSWLNRTKDFRRVMYRRQLDPTRRARLLLAALTGSIHLTMTAGVALVVLAFIFNFLALAFFGVALILAAPIIWAYLIGLLIKIAHQLVTVPDERRAIAVSKQIFADFTGPKIAIAGSYGKTTMKEILLAVLSEGKNVAATPGNKNVVNEHAKFARNLTGQEDILIIELGEGKPGDVASFAAYTQPTEAVITGLAPAHLDKYKTLDSAANDIFSVGKSIKKAQIYVNSESAATKKYLKLGNQSFDRRGALGWKISDVELEITGMDFTLQKGKRKLRLHTALVGEHLLGPLALAAGLASKLGLTDEQIIRGIASTKPFEHRMQPYRLSDGWVIDDSYNGNLEGIRAGTELLKKLPAKRKIYVTPGLVEQGAETEKAHCEFGRLIAKAEPDEVVLMQNSVTEIIKAGLEAAGFSGRVSIKQNPLEFYQNLEHFIAAGDLIMLQNDWTDNYA